MRRCKRCGKKLVDPESIAIGYGKKCAKLSGVLQNAASGVADKYFARYICTADLVDNEVIVSKKGSHWQRNFSEDDSFLGEGVVTLHRECDMKNIVVNYKKLFEHYEVIN